VNTRGNSSRYRRWGSEGSREPARARTRRRGPSVPDNRSWLDLDERIRLGELQPGACRNGQFVWQHPSGHTTRVSYEADMTGPATGWLRLWFVNRSKTGNRQVANQFVRVATASDGRWQFVVGRCTSSRLYLRPGGKRFKCPAVAGARRNRRKRWRMWPRRITTNSAAARCALHIDDLLRAGALKPGELRNGDFRIPVGNTAVSLRFSSDLFDPHHARLWLYFNILEGTEWRHVSQEVQLAKGEGQWWFREDDRIGVELVLRNGRFHVPVRARCPSKPLRHVPHEKSPERGPQTAGNALAIAARQSTAVRTAATSTRGGWLSRLSLTKKASARVVARRRARSERKPHIFARARAAAPKQIVDPWRFVTDLVKRLMGAFRKQTERLANSWADACRNGHRGKTIFARKMRKNIIF
jgi:hypothetical protein